ncbi:MAG TPA: carbohydrate kinase family protein [Candidatus Bathyarchaeia archaeon]|nr:carbohydrate kinase family protein [Candidatus Bathyarchaeia archaeon]
MSIVCVGQLVADIVVRPVEALPFPGRTTPVEELDLLSGGCAANTAAVLAKLGADARLVALIGRDALGEAALADQVRAGVNVDAVSRDEGVPTSVAIVLVDGAGQRSFYYRAGSLEAMANRHVPDHVLSPARVVHVGGAMKMLNLDLAELMGRAKSLGALTSLDTDWDIYGNWMRLLEKALPKIDFLLTNEEEAAELAGKKDPADAARVLLTYGPKAVAVKRGEKGSLLATKDGVSEFPAYRVEVRDTTCAGDAFVAGFLLGASSCRPLGECMRLGNAAGALCTTMISHRGVASLEAVRRLIEEQR